MDRLLRPKVLEIDTTTPNAEKLYRHWKITFENNLENSIPPVTPGTPGDNDSMAVAANATAVAERKKRHALINNVSADIYELISDCTTYTHAITTLDAAYIRPTSVVYSRHQLITTQQDAGQTVDAYLQKLNRLAKSCNFEAVTAEENKNQYVRDAFINGISSTTIRQRLLENMGELTLQQACTQARALEQAQNQSVAYEHNTVAVIDETVAAAGRKNKNFLKDNTNSTNNSHTRSNNNNNQSKDTCWFCGNSRHERSQCPARNDECLNCQKKGHWSRVCKSKSAIASIGATNNTENVLQQQQQQQHQQQHQQQQQQQQQSNNITFSPTNKVKEHKERLSININKIEEVQVLRA